MQYIAPEYISESFTINDLTFDYGKTYKLIYNYKGTSSHPIYIIGKNSEIEFKVVSILDKGAIVGYNWG